jgi:hypothetical protein
LIGITLAPAARALAFVFALRFVDLVDDEVDLADEDFDFAEEDFDLADALRAGREVLCVDRVEEVWCRPVLLDVWPKAAAGVIANITRPVIQTACRHPRAHIFRQTLSIAFAAVIGKTR